MKHLTRSHLSLSTSQRSQLQILLQRGFVFQHEYFGRNKNIQFITSTVDNSKTRKWEKRRFCSFTGSHQRKITIIINTATATDAVTTTCQACAGHLASNTVVPGLLCTGVSIVSACTVSIVPQLPLGTTLSLLPSLDGLAAPGGDFLPCGSSGS